MKNKGIIMSLIIILVILIIFLIAFLYMNLTGRAENIFFMGEVKKYENIIFDKVYDEKIEKLEIISSAGDINFKESLDGKFKVVVYGRNAQDLKVEFENSILRIDYSEKNKIISFGVNKKDILIYIPKEYENYIDLRADYGDIDIADLENADISIKESCGNVKLGKIKNARIENSYGDIKIEEVLNKCDIKNDCGDIKIQNLYIQEFSNINSSFGDIKIGNTNEIYVDAKTDLGDLKINTNNRYSETILKIKNSCGDIKIEN